MFHHRFPLRDNKVKLTLKWKDRTNIRLKFVGSTVGKTKLNLDKHTGSMNLNTFEKRKLLDCFCISSGQTNNNSSASSSAFVRGGRFLQQAQTLPPRGKATQRHPTKEIFWTDEQIKRLLVKWPVVLNAIPLAAPTWRLLKRRKVFCWACLEIVWNFSIFVLVNNIMKICKISISLCLLFMCYYCWLNNKYNHLLRITNSQTGRQTGRLVSRQIKRNLDRQADRRTERQAHSWSLATLTPGKLFATMHTEGGYEKKVKERN